MPPYRMRRSAYCSEDHTRIVRGAKKDLIRAFEKKPQMGYAFMTDLITVVGNRFHRFQDEAARAKGMAIPARW